MFTNRPCELYQLTWSRLTGTKLMTSEYHGGASSQVFGRAGSDPSCIYDRSGVARNRAQPPAQGTTLNYDQISVHSASVVDEAFKRDLRSLLRCPCMYCAD